VTPLQPEDGVSHGTFSASLPGPSRRAAATRSGYLGEVASEAADDLILTLNEAATNAILYGSGGGQPVQVVVHISDDVIEASVLDHGSDLPARPPTDADTDALACAAGACGCCAGWWMRGGSARTRPRSRATALQALQRTKRLRAVRLQ
jgi:hypothetical protein